MNILYRSATDVSLAQKERVKAAEELKKQYPASFANSSNQSILNGNEKKSYDLLTDSIIKNSQAKAAKDRLDKLAADRLDIEFQKQKIRNANANENKRAKDITVFNEVSGDSQTTSASSVKLINNERANKALADEDGKLKVIKSQEDFLIKFAGNEALLNSVIKKSGKEKVKSTKEANEALRLQIKVDSLISGSKNKSLSKDGQEIQAIKDKFSKISEEVSKFNSNPKNKYKVDGSGLASSEKKEISDVNYKNDTEKLKTALEQQKQIFTDYEKYKLEVGETFAQERYGKDLEIAKETQDKAAKELAGLLTLQATGNGLTNNQQERLNILVKNLKAESDLKQQQQDKDFADALNGAKTHTKILADIQKEYNDKITALKGKGTDEQIAYYQKERDEKTKAENISFADTENSYANLLGSFDTMTKQKVIITIEGLKKQYKVLLDSNQITEAEYKSHIQALNDANEKFGTGTDNAFQKVGTAFKKYKSATDEVSKKSAFKNLASEAGNAADVVGGVFNEVVGGLQTLGIGTDKYTQATLKSVSGIVGGIGDLGKGLATGNPIDIVKGSIAILTNALDLFNTKDKKLEHKIDAYKADLKSLQDAYEKLDKAVQNSVGESIYSDQAAQIENLKKQQQDLIGARNAEQSKKKTDGGKVADYNKQIDAIPGKIDEINKAISQELIQGSFKDFSNSLADALTSAFQSGEDGIASMDKSFNSFIGNAIKNSLKLKLIEPIVKGLTDDLVTYAKGNNNSIIGFDFTSYKTDLQTAGKTFTDALDANKEFFVDTANSAATGSQNSLSGQIKGITAEQANLLAGQFGGLRLTQLMTNDILNYQLTVQKSQLTIQNGIARSLVNIEAHTFRTANNTDRLSNMENILNNINNKIDSAANALKAGGVI